MVVFLFIPLKRAFSFKNEEHKEAISESFIKQGELKWSFLSKIITFLFINSYLPFWSFLMNKKRLG